MLGWLSVSSSSFLTPFHCILYSSLTYVFFFVCFGCFFFNFIFFNTCLFYLFISPLFLSLLLSPLFFLLRLLLVRSSRYTAVCYSFVLISTYLYSFVLLLLLSFTFFFILSLLECQTPYDRPWTTIFSINLLIPYIKTSCISG